MKFAPQTRHIPVILNAAGPSAKRSPYGVEVEAPARRLSRAPKSRAKSRELLFLSLLSITLLFFLPSLASAQALAKRLILKDGSYQSITKYEIKGDRVRYYSAERGEWEEVPKSLVDWDATDKYQKGLLENAPSPEALELDKELEAEQKAEEARSPHVAPGLRLPDDGGVFLLDTYQNQAQLDELQQAGGELKRNTKSNILRSTINPLASAKQTIELAGEHARIQSHVALPSLYINLDPEQSATGAAAASATANGEPAAPAPNERFKIIRAESKGGKRIAGGVKIAVYGKVKADQRFVPTTVTPMTGGWVKITPTEPLPHGEYAVAEMLGKEGMNLYVWDFGVNPSAPANASAWKPDPHELEKKPDSPIDLKKKEK